MVGFGLHTFQAKVKALVLGARLAVLFLSFKKEVTHGRL